jgi:hypothetical protein
MKILLGGLFWIAMSVLMARPGFFNYCVWRGVGGKSKDPDQIYLAAKPKLLSINWLYWTLITAASACSGLWLIISDEPDSLSQMIGVALLVMALGLLIGFHIIRAGRIWNDVS